MKSAGVSRFFPIATIFPLLIKISEFSIIPSLSLVHRVAFLKWMDWLFGIDFKPNPTFGNVTFDTNDESDFDLDDFFAFVLFSTFFFETVNEKLLLLKSEPVPERLVEELIFVEICANEGFSLMLSKSVKLNQSSTSDTFDLISVESLLIFVEGFVRLFEIFISYDLSLIWIV